MCDYRRKSNRKPGGALTIRPMARSFASAAAKASSQAAVQILNPQVAAVRGLLRTAKTNYPAAKIKLMSAMEKPFTNMRASLKNDKISIDKKTLQTMRSLLSPEDYVDFCMTFIFTDKLFKRGANDLRFKMFEMYGIKRNEIRGFYKTGIREYWEYISEAVKVAKQTEQGLIYNGAIHNLDHVVEIQTLMTVFIEHQILAAAGLANRNNIKTQLIQSCNSLIDNNITFIESLKAHIGSKENVHIIEKDINALKQKVISKILYSRVPINKDDTIFESVTPALKAGLISYCQEIVIPFHNNLISFIEFNHASNILGLSIIQKCQKINKSLDNICSSNSTKGGFQSMEELEPKLDTELSRNILKQIYEDLNSEDLILPEKTPLFTDLLFMTALHFLELRDFAFNKLQDLDSVKNPQLMGGNKTRKSKSRLTKRAL
jgi:hypothetical protein